MIDRNDGLGFCFPGGSARRYESDADAMKREVFEETGLRVTAFTELYQYDSKVFYPHTTAVFHGQATGEPRKSWEGTPMWLKIPQMERKIFPPHQIVLNRLKLELRGTTTSASQA